MLPLKDYQERALETLSEYLKLCKESGEEKQSFAEITKQVFNVELPYKTINVLPDMPYVCLRIPTGGGKTLVGCHSIAVTNNDYLQVDHSTVLWLVPSNAILEQTLKAFKDKSHPYRVALDEKLGSVTVLDITEALMVKKATLDGSTTIIIATMQSFRIDDTQGRKVYQSSGDLMDHFTIVPKGMLNTIERESNGSFQYSLANVLKLRRPIVIVDEAHNSRTNLSFDTLARFNPSCILEYTATPDTKENPSNVLYSVSAAELKAEAMIKIPIMLQTKNDWEELLSDAIEKRNALDELSGKGTKYIRPVMLIQAQPKQQGKNNLTVEIIKKSLIEDHKIPKNQIAIQTSDIKDLDNVDILSEDCEIKYIITVQALKEGWDCPFAYVLCSFADLSANVAVEQILGRIIRLPYADWNKDKRLNKSYAFALSANFIRTANSLRDALISNGFSKQEVKDLISKMKNDNEQISLDLFSSSSDDITGIEYEVNQNTFTTKVNELPRKYNFSNELSKKIQFNNEDNTVSISGHISDDEMEEIQRNLSNKEDQSTINKIINFINNLTPSERGVEFDVPVLSYKQGDIFEVFEESHFLQRPWNINKYEPTLTEKEFTQKRPMGNIGEITVSNDGQIKTNFIQELDNQMTFFSVNKDWSIAELVFWIDRKIYTPDIPCSESEAFINKLVINLISNRGFDLEQLVVDKYRLKEAIKYKIEKYRELAMYESYQQTLFSDSDSLTVTPELTFSFKPEEYPCNTQYDSKNHEFKKHYYPVIGDLVGRGEEFECAQYLDSLPEVEFWVRNLPRRPNHSFWLQTSTDKFYPDFVCKLKDGRYLVVEYKGEDRWSDDDSREKRSLGELWEKKSGGTCLFVMPKGADLDSIRNKITITYN